MVEPERVPAVCRVWDTKQNFRSLKQKLQTILKQVRCLAFKVETLTVKRSMYCIDFVLVIDALGLQLYRKHFTLCQLNSTTRSLAQSLVVRGRVSTMQCPAPSPSPSRPHPCVYGFLFARLYSEARAPTWTLTDLNYSPLKAIGRVHSSTSSNVVNIIQAIVT